MSTRLAPSEIVHAARRSALILDIASPPQRAVDWNTCSIREAPQDGAHSACSRTARDAETRTIE